jgi:hypothetical protein
VQVRLQASDVPLLNGRIASVRSSLSGLNHDSRLTLLDFTWLIIPESIPSSYKLLYHYRCRRGHRHRRHHRCDPGLHRRPLLARRQRYLHPSDGVPGKNAEQPPVAPAASPSLLSAKYPLHAGHDSTMFYASAPNSTLQSAGPGQPPAGGLETNGLLQHEQGHNVVQFVELQTHPTVRDHR